MIIDTHIHLDNERYKDDLNEVLNRSREKNVSKFIIPGADPKTIDNAIKISELNKDVFFAVGIHPYDIESFTSMDELEKYIEKYICHEKCIAVGECGLDYFRLEGSNEEKNIEKLKQKDVFITQINLAKKYNKPLIVHIRDASNDAKKILLDFNAGNVGGVLHCYNADEQLLSLANENFYFGIGGVVTFKNARKLIEILPKIPKEKLLIETDGPYLTPTPYRGERNEPQYCTLIVEKISQLLEIHVDEVKETTTKNALNLFSI